MILITLGDGTCTDTVDLLKGREVVVAKAASAAQRNAVEVGVQ